MSTNLDIKVIGTKIAKLGKKAAGYLAFIAVIVVLAGYSFIVYRIDALTSHEPDDEVVMEQLKNLRKPSIDQETVDKIKSLEDSNIQVKALFDHARDNPFQD